jgi:hypothetical protein
LDGENVKQIFDESGLVTDNEAYIRSQFLPE